MNNNLLSRGMLCLILLTATAVTGCTDRQTATSPTQGNPVTQPQTQPALPQEGGELVVAAPESTLIIDPYGVSKKETELNAYEQLTYRGLFTRADDQSLAPALATEYKIDRSQPKPAVVVTLRKGTTWSDGKPVTVDDVLYTFEEYARPHYYGVWRESIHLLQGISPYRTGKAAHIAGITTDPKTGVIRFSLERDDITFLQLFTAPLLPKHQLIGKPVEELNTMSRAGVITGAGPFQIRSVGSRALNFDRNKNYYGTKAHLNSIRVVTVAQADLAKEVSEGRIHWSWVSPEQTRQLQDAQTAGASVKAGTASGYHFVGFNLQSKLLQDIAVRKALAQVISPEAIAQEKLFGLAEPVNSPLSPESFAYVSGNFPTTQVEAAQNTLNQKGFTKEKPLTLTFAYPDDSSVRERLVEAVVQAWKTLPVNVVKKPLAPDEFVAYLFGGSPTDLYLYAWEYPGDPAEMIRLWHSREQVGEHGLNASRYRNQRADELLQRGQLLLPQEERKKLFTEWQTIFAADLPIIPLVQIRNHYYISNHLHGVDEKLGMQPFAKIEDWYLN